MTQADLTPSIGGIATQQIHTLLDNAPPLDQSVLNDALTMREAAVTVRQETERANAAFFAGKELYRFIEPFSFKEGDKKLDWRRARTIDHYENYPDEVSACYVEGVYKTKEVIRKTGNKDLDDYLATDYDNWFQQDVAVFSLLYPEPWIFFEAIDTDMPLLTKQNQADAQAWVRPVLVDPSTVINFKLDQTKKLEWVSRNVIASFDGAKPCRCIEITTKAARYYVDDDDPKNKGQVLQSELHGFDFCPVVWKPWRMNRAHGGKCGRAFLYPIINKAIASLQVISMLVETGYVHLNMQLLVDAVTGAGMAQTGAGNMQPIVVATTEDADGRKTVPFKPEYLQKPTAPITVLLEWVFSIIPKSVYRSARLRYAASNNTSASSGAAIAMEAMPETRALSGISNYYQSIDADVVYIIARSYDDTIQRKDVTVTYPSHFGLDSNQEAMKSLTDLSNIEKNGIECQSPSAIGEMMKRAYRALLPDATPALLATIDAEIDDWVADEIAEPEETVPPIPTSDAQSDDGSGAGAGLNPPSNTPASGGPGAIVSRETSTPAAPAAVPASQPPTSTSAQAQK